MSYTSCSVKTILPQKNIPSCLLPLLAKPFIEKITRVQVHLHTNQSHGFIGSWTCFETEKVYFLIGHVPLTSNLLVLYCSLSSKLTIRSKHFQIKNEQKKKKLTPRSPCRRRTILLTYSPVLNKTWRKHGLDLSQTTSWSWKKYV